MEPNKFEKQFRTQLNAREIQPSANAWDKLDAMLSATEKPKTKFPWLYVAAGFTALLLIGTAYYDLQKNPIENQENGVVIKHPVAPKTGSVVVDYVDLIKGEKESKKNVVQQSVLKNNPSYKLKQETIAVKNNLNQVDDVVVINQEARQESISTQTNAVTVEELLARVDKSARMRNNHDSELKVHVDPNQLLQQIETDLEPTFRQKVFSKVAENYSKVKEAIVNRNKE
ncbi:hypothetical protein [Flavobacterium flavipallidum]|uniref:Anti-sigma factor n=1 Tax=Flavobacterium flavipallidum TaxID=3139140 RepID=A0ABU9HPW6_9FLAO